MKLVSTKVKNTISDISAIVVMSLMSTNAFAQVEEIPEPSVLGLLGIGVLALLVARRRK